MLAELSISPDEALLILKVANIHNDAGLSGESKNAASKTSRHWHCTLLRLLAYLLTAGARSAQHLYEKELAARKIITFCGDLDGMLGGGVATGQITEFCKL